VRLRYVAMALSLLFAPTVYAADPPATLTASSFTPAKGTVFLFANWGRAWKCGAFENAQLQAIAFAKVPYSGLKEELLSLEPRSTLLANDKWLLYAYVVEPGEYALASFDLKVAKSVKDVRRLKPGASDLFKDNKPIGGTFKVAAGEIVYIGNFWVDCTTPDPIPWRYFSTREEFARDVTTFRKAYPFTKDVPILYRLFATELIGQMYDVEEYSVK
jgi:hypothetical protein